MQKQFLEQNYPIPYTLRISQRARHLRISVACDSSVVLTMPQGFNLEAAEQFFKSKLSWVLKALEYFKPYQHQPLIKSGRREYLKHREPALILARDKVKQWNEIYNFNYQQIKIGNQKTRWGSCSKKGNINFNYKIVHLPENLLDYLVVHELCHLKELNHSKKFWELVSQAVPEFKTFRRQLRDFVFS